MKNRRADIPITILVLGVVAICGLAILSFVVSKNSVLDNYNDPLGLSVFEQVHSDVEKFEFYKKVGVAPSDAASRIVATFSGNELLIKNRKDVSRKVEIVSYKYTKP